MPGMDWKQEMDKLIAAIRYPKYLYRYRAVNVNNLEALRTNHLYFSSADHYDDPFDTFLNVDIEAIEKEYLSAFKTPESTKAVVCAVKDILNDMLTEEQKEQLTAESVIKMISDGWIDNFLRFTLSLRDVLQKNSWSACFSENGSNDVLWMKYADQHRGFALMYDLEKSENFRCGKQDKCKQCGVQQSGTPLYPVYYSDTPYDATHFAKFVMMHKIRELTGKEIPQQIYENLGTSAWEQERITLIKKKCHEYDQEWRMMTGQMKPPVMIEWIPSGVILGMKMGIAEENLVVSMAREAGIKNIYRSYIDAKNRLSVVLLT